MANLNLTKNNDEVNSRLEQKWNEKAGDAATFHFSETYTAEGGYKLFTGKMIANNTTVDFCKVYAKTLQKLYKQATGHELLFYSKKTDSVAILLQKKAAYMAAFEAIVEMSAGEEKEKYITEWNEVKERLDVVEEYFVKSQPQPEPAVKFTKKEQLMIACYLEMGLSQEEAEKKAMEKRK